MSPAVEALQRDLVSLMQVLLMADNDAAAIGLIRDFQVRIEAALALVEVRT